MTTVITVCSMLLVITPVISALSVARRTSQTRQLTLQMSGYSPMVDDDYVATSAAVSPGYIVRFEPIADADRIHHILLYGCDQPAHDKPVWRGLETCRGSAHILYAWARNAPDLRVPENVGFSVGHESDSIKYIVMQVHYAHPFSGKVLDYSGVNIHLVEDRPKYLAAVLLFVSGSPIPPGHSHYQTNMSCTYQGETPIYPFAFRTHTHGMGRVVSAFYLHAGTWTMIGKRNPQWPQLFEPISRNLSIESGDLMAATCVFDSTTKSSTVRMGNTGNDEMCNFYMMFYWDAQVSDPFPSGSQCFVQEKQEFVNGNYPESGITLLPPHPDWEHQAHQSTKPFGIAHEMVATAIENIPLGQVTALSFDTIGNLVIFHRASRVWDENSFGVDNNLRVREAIPEDVILVASPSGPKSAHLKLVAKYGHGKFYMPHGLTIDGLNNYYTTDVGSHLVIKWTILKGELIKVFALGEAFVSGDDQNHFCKPTSVAVTPDGTIYVADGYCNNRIIKFDSSGNFIGQWGQPSYSGASPALGTFSLPHDISSNEDGTKIYVADRQNARVQIFNENGQPLGQITNPLGSNIFWTVYSAHYTDRSVYFIPGESHDGQPVWAFNAHASSARVQFSFRPLNFTFKRPHIIRASPDKRFVYVGELGDDGGRICQFAINREANKQLSEGSSSSRSGSHLLSLGNVKHFSKVPSSLMLMLTIVALPFIVILVYRKRKLMRAKMQHSVLDRAGFKPLRTEDPESSDDDTEDEKVLSRRKGNNRL